MVWSEHDANFKQLNSQVGAGHSRVGGSGRKHSAAWHEGRQTRAESCVLLVCETLAMTGCPCHQRFFHVHGILPALTCLPAAAAAGV